MNVIVSSVVKTIVFDDLTFLPILFVKIVVLNLEPLNIRLKRLYEPVHEISNNVVCATSEASDQPAHTRSLIRAFASRLSII